MYIYETAGCIYSIEALWKFLNLQLCNVMIVCQFSPNGLVHGPKTCQIWYDECLGFAEPLLLYLLDGFATFVVLWNYLDLQLCKVNIICQFTPYHLSMSQTLVISGTNGVQTLPHAYIWKLDRFSPFKTHWNWVKPYMFYYGHLSSWPIWACPCTTTYL